MLPECTLPLSAANAVDMVITELAVFEIRDGKFLLTEYAPGVTVEEILAKTEGEVVVSENIKEFFS